MKRQAVALTALLLLANACSPDTSTTSGSANNFSAAATAKPASTLAATAPASSSNTQGAGNVVKTASGLQYVDEVVGTGASAEKGKTVTVHYTGTLKDGKKFDSSLDRGQPFSFPLGAGQVIKGWDEGVAGMKVGGKRKLIIPAELGYGSQGAGGGVIPPNAELTFEVQLLSVK